MPEPGALEAALMIEVRSGTLDRNVATREFSVENPTKFAASDSIKELSPTGLVSRATTHFANSGRESARNFL